MNKEELQFIAMMYDQFYNGWHVSETDLKRYIAIVKRLKDIARLEV